MKMILLKDVESVGRKGQEVNVRDGYARNFLIPKGLGFPSTGASRKFIEEQKMRAEKRHAQEKAEAERKAKELEQMTLAVEAAAGDNEKLFGSVTAEDIRQALADKGYNVDKKRIQLKDPIRALGTHTVVVEVYPQVKTSVTIDVVRKA
ncbi:MAG: 50S ribosomal protein L9 [Candidatus Omnitrophica bacterium]|nr:50S ribosomal protein L9 [Candidatus Omnitrophota bacterium]MDD5671105.1 50S ribosomal protein L9 [Candidatus Omnitrophota bacterium]